MANVVNNIVKMEWDKSGWLQTTRGQFIMGSVPYPSSKYGEVTIFFDSTTAFIWASDAGTADEDLWNAKELKSFLKTNYDISFPCQYDEYVPVVNYGADEVDIDVLDTYGISVEYADEIVNRVKDLFAYGVEKDVELK